MEFKAKVRRISQSSYGLTFPKIIIDRYGILENNEIEVKLLGYEDIKGYRCNDCGYMTTFSDDKEVNCSKCGSINIQQISNINNDKEVKYE